METVLRPTVTRSIDSELPVFADKEIQDTEVLEQCLSLDLTLVKANAVKKFGWSDIKADKTEYLYKRFLFLCYKYKG